MQIDTSARNYRYLWGAYPEREKKRDRVAPPLQGRELGPSFV